jgi:tetratricopeptide (TPR) repeat protein
MDKHYWIRASHRRDRDRVRASIGLPATLAVIDAHQRLRGPYTAAGTLLRLIGEDALARCPDLGSRHHIEIRETAPELCSSVPGIETLPDLSVTPGERARYQARLHTLRIAHGLTEFVRDYLAALGGGPRTLVVDNAHCADPTDQEFLAVLLRRFAPEQLTIVVGTGTGPLTDPPGPVAVSLTRALADYATQVDGPAAGPTAATAGQPTAGELARAYVESDGTSTDPAHHSAYAALPAKSRAALHDERLLALLALRQPSLLLGAVPYHAEHGSDPAGAGAQALRTAQVYCKARGFYHAAADLGLRGRKLVDRLSETELWWDLTGDMTISLASAGRAAEAEAIHDETRRLSTAPAIHMHLAYATGMLYTRHYEEERRDHRQARAWLNLAVAIASLLEDPKERTFYSVFNNNGLALVEVREGRAAEALRLLSEGMERLDQELAPGEQAQHRIGLRYNRAQVYGMIGRLEEAHAEYTAVMEVDQNFPDHYFNRGNILRRLGRAADAIADYENALRLSPPFPEVYYNRGDARLELGDVDGALADFSRVIELDPDHVDARVNRAAILSDLGDSEASWRDVTAGLALDPGHAHLLCLRGRLLAEQGESALARDALSAALTADERLAEAWAIRGVLAHEAGDLATAISDLDRAVGLASSPEIRFNRGVAYQDAGRFTEAIADYEMVLAVADDAEARHRREACLSAVAPRAMA